MTPKSPHAPGTAATEKLVLTFPMRQVREPIMYKLVKEYDLMVNIMRALIKPDEQGHMVVELGGTREHLAAAREYLKKIGIRVEPLSRDVHRSEERCTHCTACITVCPSGALDIDRATMQVNFDDSKCIGCGLCIPVCSYHAMEIKV
jgi:L-aspartate semialdehyde sulfurtransferase ferredoxin